MRPSRKRKSDHDSGSANASVQKVCKICEKGNPKNRFYSLANRPEDFALRATLDAMSRKKGIDLQQTDNICYACDAKAKRMLQEASSTTQEAEEGNDVQNDVECTLVQFGKCQDIGQLVPGFSVFNFSMCFELNIPNAGTETGEIYLCRAHNQTQKNWAVKKAKTCEVCTVVQRDKCEHKIHYNKETYEYMCKSIRPGLPGNLPSQPEYIACNSCYLKVHRHFKDSGDQSDGRSASRFERLLTGILTEPNVDPGAACIDSDRVNYFCLIKSAQYLAMQFQDKKACLHSTVYDVYEEEFSRFPNVDIAEKTPVARHCLELKDLFEDGLTLENDANMGNLLMWKRNDIKKSLFKALYDMEQNKKTLQAEMRNIRERYESAQGEENVLRSAGNILRSKIESNIEDLNAEYGNKAVDLSDFKFDAFVNNIEPFTWNFLTFISLSKREAQSMISTHMNWQVRYTLPEKVKGPPRVMLFSMINFLVTNGECKYPLHILLSDVISKYTNSSDDCMTIGNRLGLWSSPDTLKRHTTELVSQSQRQPLEARLTLRSLRIVSIDNINVRNPYAIVRSGQVHRGLDGTSVQTSEPAPSKIKMGSEELAFSKKCFRTSDNEIVIKTFTLIGKEAFYYILAARFIPGLVRKPSQEERGDLMRLMHILGRELREELLNDVENHRDEIVEKFGDRFNHQEIVSLTELPDLPDLLTAISFVRHTGCVLKLYVEEPDSGEYTLRTTFENLAKAGNRTHSVMICLTLTAESNQTKYVLMMDRATYFHDLSSPMTVGNLFRPLLMDNSMELMPFTDAVDTLIKTKKPRSRSLARSLLPADPDPSAAPTGPSEVDYTDLPANFFLPTEDESEAHRDLSQAIYSILVARNSFNDISAQENKDKTLALGLRDILSTQTSDPPEKSNIVYMFISDKNADSIDSMKYMLEKIREDVGIDELMSQILVVGDGKTFDYILQLKDLYGAYFDWVLPYPGDWHIMKNFAYTLMKVYGPAGLHELLDIHHKGSTAASVQAARDFEKTKDFIFFAFEAIFRVIFEMYWGQCQHDDPSKQDIVTEMDELMSAWKIQAGKNVFDYDKCAFNFNRLREEQTKLDSDFLRFVERCSSTMPVFKFWVKDFLLRDCMTFVGFYLSLRSGNFAARCYYVEKMIPLFSISGSTFYFRLLPTHLAQLRKFPRDIFQSLSDGAFGLSFSGEKWCMVGLDEGHEMKINKEVKEAIHSTADVALQSKLAYLPIRAVTIRNFREQLEIKNVDSPRKFDSFNKVLNEELIINDYHLKFATAFLNEHEKPSLVHIFSKKEATGKVKNDMTSFYQLGEKAVRDFVDCQILKTKLPVEGKTGPYHCYKISNFDSAKKIDQSKLNTKRKLKRLESELELYKKAIIHAQLTNTTVPPMENFVNVPAALKDDDQVSPFKSDKAEAKRYYEEHKVYGDCFTYEILRSTVDVVIFDAMFLLHSTPKHPCPTFEHYAQQFYRDRIKQYFSAPFCAKEVHVVFDCHDMNVSTSPKAFERARRDSSRESAVYDEINDQTVLKWNIRWEDILSDRHSKQQIVKYLCIKLVEIAADELAGGQRLYTNRGSSNASTCLALVSDSSNPDRKVEATTYSCCHEEADTLVWFHAVQCGYKKVLIYSPDTDVFNIGLRVATANLDKEFTVELKKKTAGYKTFIRVSDLAKELHRSTAFNGIDPLRVAEIMVAVYVCSGCDYVSSFRHHAKKSWYEVFFKHANFVLGDNCQFQLDSEEGFLSLVKLVGCVYFKGAQSNIYTAESPSGLLDKVRDENAQISDLAVYEKWLGQIREALITKAVSTEKLPPSMDALKLHWKRTCWVLKVYFQASNQVITYPPLDEHGWSVENGELKIIWDSQENIDRQNTFLDMFTGGCSCKTDRIRCGNRCGCRRKGKYCKPSCKCRSTCSNGPPDSSMHGLSHDNIEPSSSQPSGSQQSAMSQGYSQYLLFDPATDDEGSGESDDDYEVDVLVNESFTLVSDMEME